MDTNELKSDLLDEAESIADDWDLPISVIVNLAIALGLPVVREIFESGNIEDVLDENDLAEEEEEEEEECE